MGSVTLDGYKPQDYNILDIQYNSIQSKKIGSFLTLFNLGS